MAEYMFKKSMSAKNVFGPNSAENLADVLYEMGKELLMKQQYTMAARLILILNCYSIYRSRESGSYLKSWQKNTGVITAPKIAPRLPAPKSPVKLQC